LTDGGGVGVYRDVRVDCRADGGRFRHRLPAKPIVLRQTFEMLVFVAALGGIAIHAWQLASAARGPNGSTASSSRLAPKRKRWSREAKDVLKGLGAAIDGQFDKWGLTPAERDVALLQLKGLRHKESPSSVRRASAPSASRPWPFTARPASRAGPTWPRSSWKISFCERTSSSGCASGGCRMTFLPRMRYVFH